MVESSQVLQGTEILELCDGGSLPHAIGSDSTAIDNVKVDEHDAANDKVLPIEMMECRICQVEDNVQHLERPCACNGTLKFVHRECLQQWCAVKEDTTCEICHQPLQPGYTASPPQPHPDIRSIAHRDLLDLYEKVQCMIKDLRLQEAQIDALDDVSSKRTLLWHCAPLHSLDHKLIGLAVGIMTSPGHSFMHLLLCLLKAAGVYIVCTSVLLGALNLLDRQRRRQVTKYLALCAELLTKLEEGFSEWGFTFPPEPAVTTE